MPPNRPPDERAERAVTPVIGVVLLVAVTVVLAAGAASFLLSTGDSLHQPPQAAVEVVQTTFTDSEDCAGASEEVAIDVTLTQFQRAETVYVVADGGDKEVLWSDPDAATVGASKRVANEAVGNGGVDVDIGGGGDVAICPGDEETFRFYASYDGQTTLLRTYTTQ